MSQRTKIVDKQMKKLQYITHVKKLQELSSERNHFQKSLRKQREEIDSLIKQSHKLHLNNLKVSSKNREMTLAYTQRKNYESVKSVVKSQLDRRILTIPSKQKPDNFYRDMNNLKLVNKILNAKSQFDFKKEAIQRMSKRITKRRLDTSQDFSCLYENLFQNHSKMKKIRIYLSKDKINVRIKVKILDQENVFQNKSNNPYVIILQNQKEQKQSKHYSLLELAHSQFICEVPPTECQITFTEIINQKKIPRFKITLRNQDFQEFDRNPGSKPIQDMKEKSIGIAMIQLKKRKSKKQANQEEQNLNVASFQTTKAQQLQKMCELPDLKQNLCSP